MLQKPYTLAEIPTDLTGSLGSILASDVHAVDGAKKRKRSELALAIDRQSVNIYDLRSAKLVTSYAVSPQTSFSCPPCSFRYRSTARQPSRRYTYCAVKTPSPRILAFSETSEATSQQGEISTFSATLKSDSPIVHLDTVPNLGEAQGALSRNLLIAIHESGEIVCYSENLEKEEWKLHLDEGPSDVNGPPPAQVRHATITTIEHARKSILKNREDLLAASNVGQGQSHGSVLLVVRESANGKPEITMQISVMKPSTTDFGRAISKSRAKLQHLTSFTIPRPTEMQTRKADFTLHVASGTLYQQTADCIIAYDLTGSLPQLLYQTELGKEQVSTCLRLSPTLVAVSSASSISTINLRYCSLQGRIALDRATIAEAPPARLNAQGPTFGSPRSQLLSYFAPLDLIVALNGRRLVVVQLSNLSANEGDSRKRKRGGLLVDSLGRGLSAGQNSSDHGHLDSKIPRLGGFIPSAENAEWLKQKSALDHFIEQGNATAFDNATSSEFGTTGAEMSNINQSKVSYVLDKIFKTEEPLHSDVGGPGDYSRKLTVTFWPTQTCDWLIKAGLLTHDRIEAGLKHYGSLPVTAKLVSGSLIAALTKWDPSLRILQSFLSSPNAMRLEDLVHALLPVMQQSHEREHQESTKLLTNLEGQPRTNSMQASTTEPSENDPDPTPKTTKPHILQQVLHRLHTLPSKHITHALKTHLTPPNLLALIDLLRLNLARAGWLSPYTSPSAPPEPDPTTATTTTTNDNNNHPPHLNPNTQIQKTTHLLNSVLDALGPTGWLLGSSSSSQTADDDTTTESTATIAYLKAEISAALEGIEEATYLRGLLGEMLLCGKNTLPPPLPPIPFSSSAAVLEGKEGEVSVPLPPSQSVTTVTTVPTISSLPVSVSGMVAGGEVNSFLPLGLKKVDGAGNGTVPLTKVAAGGEVVRRSRRDVGRLKSRGVGRYTFERIVV